MREMTPLKIAVWARDPSRAGELASSLAGAGFSCLVISDDVAGSGLTEEGVDLVVADPDAPPFTPDAESLVRRIGQERNLSLILLLNEPVKESRELDTADDFVVKPFHVSELAVRIRRVLKSTQLAERGARIGFGDLAIDTDACQVFLGRRALDLTFMEYELLKFLAENPGKVFTREALLRNVWGYDYYGGERTVDVHIRRLRSKLEVGDDIYIETVRGQGYRFTRG